MKIEDLTIIFLTINKLPEKWVKFHKEQLLNEIGDTEVITVSKEPMDWGTNLIQEEEPSVANIYYQMLRAAKIAKTKYVAIVEDDTLYPREHFTKFRPKDDEFAYNMTRWGLFTWGKPTFNSVNRVSNMALIAPTELLIESLQERHDKYPDGVPERYSGEVGKWKVESKLGVTSRKSVTFYTTEALVFISHKDGLDPLEKSRRKRMGYLRAYEIPRWGNVEDVIKHYEY